MANEPKNEYLSWKQRCIDLDDEIRTFHTMMLDAKCETALNIPLIDLDPDVTYPEAYWIERYCDLDKIYHELRRQYANHCGKQPESTEGTMISHEPIVDDDNQETPEEGEDGDGSGEPKSTFSWVMAGVYVGAAVVLLLVFLLVKTTLDFDNYKEANPPVLNMEVFEAVAKDHFTDNQWALIETAYKQGKVEASYRIGRNGDDRTFIKFMRLPGNPQDYSYEVIARLELWYSSYDKEWRLASHDWLGGCACGSNCPT